MPELTVRATARREIKAHGIYLKEHAGAEVADRFLAAVKDTFEDLARMPRMGVLCGFRRASTRRLQTKDSGVEVVHLMHGARDIESLLDG